VQFLLPIFLRIKLEGFAERLESFWKYLSTPTTQISQALKQWKAEYKKGNNPSVVAAFYSIAIPAYYY
jgi:hypothetical protein